MAGAEPFSASGGPAGALVLHGFTGSPHSMRGIAQALANAGFTVELPLLPGHGTAVEDMVPTGWSDWYGAAQAAYDALAGRCERLVVVGLSMGGTLAASLAADRVPAGLVAVNPHIQPAVPNVSEVLQGMLDQGEATMPAIGGDVAQPETVELAYAATPIAALLSLLDASAALVERLPSITCPTLIFTSRQDHIVDNACSDLLAARCAGPVERVWLDRSYHVATLDFDAATIEAGTVDFARKVTAG